MPETESTSEAANTPPVEPSPRAFATGTGAVFQSLGLVLLFGACCFWSLSGTLVERASEPAANWTTYLAGDRMPAAALTIGVATTLIGGIGLVGIGIGLHGERPDSGKAATVLTAVMAVIYWTLTLLLLTKGDRWLQALPSAAFGVLSTFLLMLSLQSAKVLRRFPPPADRNVVTDEFLNSRRSH